MTEPWTFPDVTGRDLLGREYRLPREFPALVNVAVIAFKRWHQEQVDAWITRLGAAGLPATPYGKSALEHVVLELPVLSGRYQLARRFIDGGMAASIKDPIVLARTITIYGSVDGLCKPLGIASQENVSVRIVLRDGTVAWGTTGQVNDADVADLLAALTRLQGHSS